jgi:anti-sigma B factor antagonist
MREPRHCVTGSLGCDRRLPSVSLPAQLSQNSHHASSANRRLRYSATLQVRDIAGNHTLFTDGQIIVMSISVLELDGNVTKVVLAGRIDIAGAREIEMPMAVIAGSRRAVVVDLSAVEFMASLGLRGIVVSARSIISKRGKIVLLMPQPQVEEVITTTGIDQLIPIYHDETDAITAVIATLS